ncbi:MAG: hypothetical protein Q9222_004672 [Ikaeria aurantiellina]
MIAGTYSKFTNIPPSHADPAVDYFPQQSFLRLPVLCISTVSQRRGEDGIDNGNKDPDKLQYPVQSSAMGTIEQLHREPVGRGYKGKTVEPIFQISQICPSACGTRRYGMR